MTHMLSVRVRPRSSQHRLVQEADGTWSAWLRSAPVDGRANDELQELLADHFNVAKSCVVIKSGAGARRKIVEIRERPHA